MLDGIGRLLLVLASVFSVAEEPTEPKELKPLPISRNARFLPESGEIVWLLSYGDYSGRDLGQILFPNSPNYWSGQAFLNVDFSDANLSGSDFNGNRFIECFFQNADLSYCDMRSMSHPFLGDDNVVRRNLFYFRDSDFTNAYIQGVQHWASSSRTLATTRRDEQGRLMLRDSRILLVDVTENDLQELDFSNCDLTNCHILTWVPPLGALPLEQRDHKPRYILDGATIRNSGVSFTDRILSFTDFQKSQDYQNGVLYGLMWTRRLYGNPTTQYVDERALKQWLSVKKERSELQFYEQRQRPLDWDLSDLVLVNCVFDHCDLTDLKLSNAYLVNCEFIDCTNFPIAEFHNTLNWRRDKMDKIRFYFSKVFRESVSQDLIEELSLAPADAVPLANYDEEYHVPLGRYPIVFKAYASTRSPRTTEEAKDDYE